MIEKSCFWYTITEARPRVGEECLLVLAGTEGTYAKKAMFLGIFTEDNDGEAEKTKWRVYDHYKAPYVYPTKTTSVMWWAPMPEIPMGKIHSEDESNDLVKKVLERL